jgi:peptidoglycan/LPS O-acetylase OafA/YrhL
MDRVMLALVVAAAGPLLTFSWTNVGLQSTVTNDHSAAGHYGFMAAFSFTIIGVGLLAGIRPDGWRLTAWVAGILPALLGVASLAYSEVDSSLDPIWALAAIAWGVLFVAAGERGTAAKTAPLGSTEVT